MSAGLKAQVQDLRERLARAREHLAKAERKLGRTRAPGARGRQARWCGCLRFTVLTIQSELDALLDAVPLAA